jgi:ribose/xylose/arabinose/galactoside ABC-type transport system permease subunit
LHPNRHRRASNLLESVKPAEKKENAMITGIVAVAITFWIVIGSIVVANGYFVYQVRMARYRVMQTLADKGQPVPVELFNGNLRNAPVGMMRGAIVLLCLGVAFGFFMWSMTAQSVFNGPIVYAEWLPTIALFPIMIGVALLLMALFERKRPA